MLNGMVRMEKNDILTNDHLPMASLLSKVLFFTSIDGGRAA